MLTAEQILAAQKANVQTLFGLTGKAFEGVEKLVELNLQVAKTALEEASETTAAALSVKDAQELLALQASMLQPTAEKAAAYGRHVYDIAAATNAEVAKAAEAQFAEAQQKFLAAGRQRRQERPGRHRERRRPGALGRRCRQQRVRERAEGRQASRRRRRRQHPGHDQHRRQGVAVRRAQQARRLSRLWPDSCF